MGSPILVGAIPPWLHRLGVAWGGFTDFGRGNPPVVAPVVGRQEGWHGGENPTRGRLLQGEIHPVDPALTGDRGAETLLTFPLNSYVVLLPVLDF